MHTNTTSIHTDGAIVIHTPLKAKDLESPKANDKLASILYALGLANITATMSDDKKVIVTTTSPQGLLAMGLIIASTPLQSSPEVSKNGSNDSGTTRLPMEDFVHAVNQLATRQAARETYTRNSPLNVLNRIEESAQDIVFG